MIPKAAALLPLTTIDLPLGNYPSVTSRVVENAALDRGVASQAPLTFATISSEESFAALGAEWDALVRAMPRPSPFLLHGWLTEWWRHYGDSAGLRVHVARRDGRLAGALPLHVVRHSGLRVLRFLGDDA